MNRGISYKTVYVLRFFERTKMGSQCVSNCLILARG